MHIPDPHAAARPHAGDLLASDDMRLLVDIGFMAVSHGLVEPAEAIFAGVIAARPAQEAGHIGQALVRLHRGEVDAAIRILEALPPTDPVRLFLGIAVSRTGARAEAEAILADVSASAPGSPFAASADAIIDALAGRS